MRRQRLGPVIAVAAIALIAIAVTQLPLANPVKTYVDHQLSLPSATH